MDVWLVGVFRVLSGQNAMTDVLIGRPPATVLNNHLILFFR